jgi:hypothetical protein
MNGESDSNSQCQFSVTFVKLTVKVTVTVTEVTVNSASVSLGDNARPDGRTETAAKPGSGRPPAPRCLRDCPLL